MNFVKLPSNSEQMLLKLVEAENATALLQGLYRGCTEKERRELHGIIRELKDFNYISVKWADNMPYIVTLNNSAITYREKLIEHTSNEMIQKSGVTNTKERIFISHRSTDKAVTDMIVDFLVGTGIPKDTIFCSSLPGNDINEKISDEVKTALKNSIVNIAILSKDYYQSVYCLNEAGILWYEDAPVIPIALPEINPTNMYGFLSNQFKLRRLDCDTDVSYIYDTVSEAISTPQNKVSIITRENNKIRERYREYLKTRENTTYESLNSSIDLISGITTDDEKIVLYYIIQKNVRKVSKSTILKWLNDCEIYNVNVDNAFDLLSSFDGGNINGEVLEFGLEAFRKYSTNATTMLSELEMIVEQHKRLAIDSFKNMWEAEQQIDTSIKLFVAYIVDEKMQSYGARWMAEGQIEDIKRWENKNMIDSTLSSNYGACLEFFIQNDFVYESDWTSYGNAREYTLATSLKTFLLNCPLEVKETLEKIKREHYLDLPF